MCGIAGFFKFGERVIDQDLIVNMVRRLEHRGPDDEGVWVHQSVALGHARLSIHDLSQAGRQPMFSFDKRWIIVFNGEIYNFLALKLELLRESNIFFSSNSDTEVLINAIAAWGISKTLQKCNGMFAFAAYHILEKKLYLARDRFGEKPLYYGLQNNIIGFASELKALKPLITEGWKFDINRDVLATYMRFGYIATPYSIYKNIKKLDTSSYLEIDSNGNQKLHCYWAVKNVLSQPKFIGTYESAVDLLETKLKDTLQLQMAADVPLGAFLSGGVDSSTIVALMQSLSPKKINTFSIGFNEKRFNEAPYAKLVAKHCGTNHTEVYVTEKDALNVIPKLSSMYDEPFADQSQIPTFLVSQIAKFHVSVSLSGDAGDELFGGYSRYFLSEKIKSRVIDRAFLRCLFMQIPVCLLRPFRTISIFPDKIMKLQAILSSVKNSRCDLYQAICSEVFTESIVLDGSEISIYDEKCLKDFHALSYQEWMMYVDAQTYMVDVILTKVDRAAMAVSLETRVPFLDHQIFEFAWSLPLSYKIRQGVGKSVLKDVLYKYVPRGLVDRPKMGFSIPLEQWLCHDLRPWAEELLNPRKILQQGYLDVNLVQQYWQEHLSGKRNRASLLWNILMFQAWFEAG